MVQRYDGGLVSLLPACAASLHPLHLTCIGRGRGRGMAFPRAASRLRITRRPVARATLSSDVRFEELQCGSQAWVPFKQPEGGSIVSSLLPKDLQSPRILTRTLDNGLKICVGASASLDLDRPGNGGFRLLKYSSKEACETECVGLAQVTWISNFV